MSEEELITIIGSTPSDERVTGQVDVSALAGMPQNLAQSAMRRSEARREHMSPPGALNLPPLLEERRLEFGLVDAIFDHQPLYDRVMLYQYDPFLTADGKYRGSKLYLPDTKQDVETKSAHTGILCGAGPDALQTLLSNGVQLGDRVSFIRMTPWSIKVDYFENAHEWVLVMSAGDLIASADLAQRIKRGECKIVYDADVAQVQVQDSEGKMWAPEVPYRAGEY